MTEHGSSNAFVAVALAVIAVAGVLYFSPYILQITGAATQGTATTQTVIGNQVPVMGPCYLSATSQNAVTLAAGPDTTRVWCNCTIVDTNGNSDISKVNATLFNSTVGEGATGASGTASTLFRYNNRSCNTYNGASNTIHANCSFDVQYFATPGEDISKGWTCKMYANDTSSASTSNTTNFTVASLIAVVINVSSVDFGSLAPNANSTAISFNVTNFGNVILDSKFAADNLTASGKKDINASNEWYSLTSGTAVDFVRVPNSTSGPSAVPNIGSYNLNVSYNGASGTTGNESNKTQYFLIYIDTGQPSGTYAGTLYVTGTANA